MADSKKCPKCGAELPANAPGGICPKCLMAVGFESETEQYAKQPEGEPTTPLSYSPSFVPPEVVQLANKFPQLEVLELLGHGGMGAVYKARQTNLDRLVALKIIRPEATRDPAFAERFHREAKTLARLSHQHIVAVYDFGEVEFADTSGGPVRPLYYFVMEFVDGANLREFLRAGELTPEQALAIVPQICEALQFAHDEGVVHRDIKPENILLDKHGRVKIADFGLAKLVTRSPEQYTLTAAHQVMGTPRYMAPEQMEGSHSVDHRADIYSLGVVFYEMLTGEVPAGHFDPPSKKVEVDVRLDEVVLRAMAREPERRYQQASEVKTDVETISDSRNRESVSTVPSTPKDAEGKLEDIRNRVRIPALGLMASGIINLLALIVLLILRWDGQLGAIETQWMALPLPLGLLAVVGALQMRQLTSYRMAFIGACSALIPAYAWFLGIPFGIWCLMLLADPGVKSAFQVAAETDIRRVNDAPSNLRTSVEQTYQDDQYTPKPQGAKNLTEKAPTWLWWATAGVFLGYWIITAASWNYGRWAFCVAGSLMIALVYTAVSWRLRYLPSLLSQVSVLKPVSRHLRWASAGLALVIGYPFLINALITSWDVWGFPELVEEIGARLSSSPHRLIRELEAFREDIPIVELVPDGGIRHVNYSNTGELWLSLLLGMGLVFLSMSCLIETPRYRWTWKGYWKPSLSLTSSCLIPLLLLMVGTQVGGSSLNVRREVRGDIDGEQVVAALSKWTEEHNYHIRSEGEWLFQTIPDGKTIGSLHLIQLEAASLFDRWGIVWGAVQEQSPSFDIQLISSINPAETIVRIRQMQATLGPAAFASDGPPGGDLGKNLLSALQTTIDKPENTTD